MNSKKTLFALFAATAFSAVGAFAQQQNFNNSSLENWHTYQATSPLGLPTGPQLQAPAGWASSDSLSSGFAPVAGLGGVTIDPKSQVSESSDAHSGSSSAQIFTRDMGPDVGVQPGMLTNAQIDVDLPAAMGGAPLADALILKGGEEISERVSSVGVWMKNGDSMNVDDYSVTVLAMRFDSAGDLLDTVGLGNETFSPDMADWTEVSIPITYFDDTTMPERLIVMLSSGAGVDTTGSATEWNSVKVDDVTYTLQSTGVRIPLMTEDEMLVYPNPSRNEVFFNLKSQINPAQYTLRITNIEGRVISEETLTNQVNQKDFSNLAKGIYVYQLTNNETHRQQIGKFVLN